MTNRLRALLRTCHAWMMALPTPLLLVAGAGLALNVASDLSNSFAATPQSGGPWVAWGIFLATAALFGQGIAAVSGWTGRGRSPAPPQKRAVFRRGGPLWPPCPLWPPRPLWPPWSCRDHARHPAPIPVGVQHAEPVDERSDSQSWRRRWRRFLRPALTYLLAAWVIWSGMQTLRVVAGMPRALASPSHYGSDEMFYAQYNAWLVLHGQNPYAGDHLAGALRFFATDQVTPLRAGVYRDPRQPPDQAQTRAIVAAYLADSAAPHPNLDPATTHSYPALSFLIAAPSVALGLPTLGYLQILALLALITGIVYLAPARWRWAALALCLLDVDGVRSVAGSDFAIWTIAGAALLWIWRDRPWRAAVVLGAMCAVQQTAWFFAPFYLVYVIRARGWRAALQTAGAALGVFALINLPWIIQSPGPWLRSLILPMTLPLFPTGGGLVGLGLGGALPLFPPFAYTILEFGTYAALLIAYWRWERFAPLVGMLLPLAPLQLAWRSPNRYIILLPLLIVLGVVVSNRLQETPAEGTICVKR